MSKFNTLTLGEMSFVESFTGHPFGDVEGNPKGTFLIAMVTVFKKREDPKFTIEDAQKLTVEEANEILGLNDEEEDPAGEE